MLLQASHNYLSNLLRPEVFGMLIPLSAVIGGIWYAAVKSRSRNSLKQSMVERGMSADEIERILKA